MSCGLSVQIQAPNLSATFNAPTPTFSVGSVTIRGIDPNEIATDEEVQDMIDRIFA